MNILTPELKWIGNSCYRILPLKDEEHEGRGKSYDSHENNVYIEDPEDLAPTTCMMMSDEPTTTEYDMDVLDSGLYRLSLQIPKTFWSRLVGQRGSAKQKVEKETRTTLSIPRNEKDGDVTITGEDRRDVLLAKSHIEATIKAARSHISYTHFLSIPIQTDEIRANYATFMRSVRQNCPSIPEEAFTPAERLHITLVMLVLTDANERFNATKVLNELGPTIRKKIEGTRLKANITGVDIMNDDPTRARVVFARVDGPLLQEIVDLVANQFHETGYVKEKDIRDRVKCHVTLINTRYLEDESSAGPRRGRYNQEGPSFDCKIILEEFRNFNFGTINIDRIEMSQFGSKRSDGYYSSSANLELY